MGAKKRPFYRFVAADSRYARDGRFLETLGYYNPMERPAKVVVEEEKVFKWLKEGARMSETVNSLFRQINLLSKWEKVKAGESGESIEIKTTIRERTKKQKRKKAAAAEIPDAGTEEAKETAETKENTEATEATETENT
jgi:small subunit ribosomal protein S16